MLLLSFPIDSPINIVMEQKVMKMNACWLWKWMMLATARIQTHMHMDGLGRSRMLPASTPGLRACGRAMRTARTKDSGMQGWVHTCSYVSGLGGLVNGIKEFCLRNYCRRTLNRVKYYNVFYFIIISLLPYLSSVSSLGFFLKDTKITHLIRLSWRFFLICFPCGGLLNTHAFFCVCVYLSDEWGLKIWSKIHRGTLEEENFLEIF